MKDIAEHILDITQNSISAKATAIEIAIIDSIKSNSYRLIISDNGVGMNKETLKKVTDPFYTSRTTRKVGLGIPLLKQNTEITGGSFSIKSEIGVGTKLTAIFVKDSFDKVPPGDIGGSIVLLVAANPTIDFIFSYTTDWGRYVFDTLEIKQVLGDVSITQNEIRKYLKEMFEENIRAIHIPDRN